MPTYLIPIVMLLIILLLQSRNRKTAAVRKVIERRKKGENREMNEFAKRFIGKECLITAFDSNHQFEGFIREVSDGALLLEKDGQLEALNLDFVIRIREYPRNKKGKKKSVVLD